MQLKKITDTHYAHETELMKISIQKRHDETWDIWVETRTEAHKGNEPKLDGAIAFANSFWRDLIGREFK